MAKVSLPTMKPNQSDELLADASKSSGPEVALAKGVLVQAKRDLRRFRSAQDAIGREMYADTYSWVTADDFTWPYSFQNVCKALRLTPESLRMQLLSGARTHWLSHSRRIADFLLVAKLSRKRLQRQPFRWPAGEPARPCPLILIKPPAYENQTI